MKPSLAFFITCASCGWACTGSSATNQDPAADVTSAATGAITEGSADAQAILRVANELSFEELTRATGPSLPRVVAQNLIDYRTGDDGAAGTADDERFDTLAELDAVPLVVFATFEAMLSFARASGWVSAPNEPSPVPDVETVQGPAHVALPDMKMTVSSIHVDTVGTPDTLELAFDITHERMDDLTIRLSHGGITILIPRQERRLESTIRRSIPLPAFAHQEKYGRWSLEVIDGASRNVGTLNAWSLTFWKRPRQFPLPRGVSSLHVRRVDSWPISLLTFVRSPSGDLSVIPSGYIPWDGDPQSGLGGTALAVSGDGSFKGSVHTDARGCTSGTQVSGRLTLDTTGNDPMLGATVESYRWERGPGGRELSDPPCIVQDYRLSYSGSSPVIDLDVPGTQVASMGSTKLKFVKRPSGERLVFMPDYFDGWPLRESPQSPNQFVGLSPIYDCNQVVSVGPTTYSEGCSNYESPIRVPSWFVR